MSDFFSRGSIIRKIESFWSRLLGSRKAFRLGIYGAPNSGKTTLASRMCKDLSVQKNGNKSDKGDSDAEIFTDISNIAHETRRINMKEKLLLSNKGKAIEFDLIDTPGIATRVDYEVFTKAGIPAREARQRAREATRGVIESIKWLDNVDMVILMMDSTKNPYNHVNLTLVGNLEARKIPFVIVANKMDLKSSKASRIEEAFPKYSVISISAKFSKNMELLYDEIFRSGKRIKQVRRSPA